MECGSARAFLDAVAERDADHAERAAAGLTRRLEAANTDRMLSGLRWLVRQRPTNPEVHLRLSDHCYATGDISSYRAHLERAKRTTITHPCTAAIELEIDVELAFAGARFDRVLDHHLLEDLRGRAIAHGTPATLLRIEEIEVVALGQSHDLEQVRVGCRRAAELAHDWLDHGEIERAASTARSAALGPMSHLGWYSEALELFQLVPFEQITPIAAASARVHTGRIAALLGLRERFEARRPNDLTGPSWVPGFEAWSSMVLAGLDGDIAAVHRYHEEAVRHFDSVSMTSHGTLLRCEAAVALSRAGDPIEALALLDTVGDRSHQSPSEFELARLTATVMAFPAQAEAAQEALSAVSLPMARKWPVLLACARASGDAATRERAVAHAVAAGHESLLRRLTERDDDRAPSVSMRISLLGTATVEVDSVASPLGRGRVQALVSRLVLDRRAWTREELAEHLDSPGDGRRAVRNTAHAIRKQVGVDLFRGDATTLGLAVTVETDVDAFERGTPAERIRLYGGPLLPHHLYDDWVSTRRVYLDRLFGEALVHTVESGAITIEEAATLAVDGHLTCSASLEKLLHLAAISGDRSASSSIDLRLHAVLG